ALANNMSVISVTGSGEVEIDRLLISKSGSLHGIECKQATLRVQRSIIKDNGGNGINASMGCNLTVKRSEIGNAAGDGNEAGGISISGGTFKLVNNIIADHGKLDPDGSTFGGVFIATGNAMGTMEFNTITSNKMADNDK